MQWKTHVRAAIVYRVYLPIVYEDGEDAAAAVDDFDAFFL
jgi:hypothetical protein